VSDEVLGRNQTPKSWLIMTSSWWYTAPLHWSVKTQHLPQSPKAFTIRLLKVVSNDSPT